MIDIPQTLRYAAVSSVCLALGVTLIPLFSHWGLHYALATTLAFGIIAAIGFVLHCTWTFSVERSFAAFLRYVSAMALNLPLTVILIGLGHDLAGLPVWMSTLLASAALFLWNYLAVRWAVLRGVSGRISGVSQ